MALSRREFSTNFYLHLTRILLPAFLSPKFTGFPCSSKVMRVNKYMSASTVNLIRPGIIIYNFSSCACFLYQVATHWGNTCTKIAEYLRGKRSIAAQVRKNAHFVSNEERQFAFNTTRCLCDAIHSSLQLPIIQDKECCVSHAVLDTGANSTNINNSRTSNST